MGIGTVLYKLRNRDSSASMSVPTETDKPASKSPTSVPEVSPSTRSPQVSKPTEPITSTRDLTGNWSVVNTVDKTSFSSFANMHIAYRLIIKQSGTDFTAEGEKLMENDQPVSAGGRSLIQLTGSIDGETVEATFVEEGARRKSRGIFVWRIEAQGARLRGTFVSTAASSSGRSVATRSR
jgi:hypothetical protein